MTREIKFRAWDKKRKEWYGASDPEITTFYGFHLFGECTGFCYPSIEDLEHLEITQFTGLYDKNGKEVYEGDVVITNQPMYDEGNTYNQVVFYNSAFIFKAIDNKLDCVVYEYSSKFIKVIGNVFENPELLEVKP